LSSTAFILLSHVSIWSSFSSSGGFCFVLVANPGSM
jgi:hypothetical protein